MSDPRSSVAFRDAEAAGGWADALLLQRWLRKFADFAYKVRDSQPALMASHRFAWQGRGGLVITGQTLPDGWANPYWEIREKSGEMVFQWGEPDEPDEPPPTLEELRKKLSQRASR